MTVRCGEEGKPEWSNDISQSSHMKQVNICLFRFVAELRNDKRRAVPA